MFRRDWGLTDAKAKAKITRTLSPQEGRYRRGIATSQHHLLKSLVRDTANPT